MLRRSGLRPWLWGALCAEDRGGRTWLKLFRRTRFTDSEEEVRKPGAGGRGFGTARGSHAEAPPAPPRAQAHLSMQRSRTLPSHSGGAASEAHT